MTYYICHFRYGSSPELANMAPVSSASSSAPLRGPVRVRRTSTNSSNARPVSVYDQQQMSQQAAQQNNRYQRATSVQPRSAADLDSRSSANGGGGDSPPIRDPYHTRAHSVSRQPPPQPVNGVGFTPLTPVSRIQIGGGGSLDGGGVPSPAPANDRPLDRPTIVRPNRTSLQHEHQQHPISPTTSTPPVS